MKAYSKPVLLFVPINENIFLESANDECFGEFLQEFGWWKDKA